jgi:aminoglycoside 3-N-acetyltransferase I
MINIRLLSTKDIDFAGDLLYYFREEFSDDKPFRLSDERLKEVLTQKDFYILGAFVEGTIVGGITAYKLLGSNYLHPELFIYDLAVKPEFRRRGIAAKLIKTAQELGAKIGATETFVFAEMDDEQAMKFYQSQKGRQLNSAMFSFNT